MSDAQITEVLDRYFRLGQNTWTIANFMGISRRHAEWAIDEAKRREKARPKLMVCK